MSLFPCPSQYSLRISNLTNGLVLEGLAWQGFFSSSHFKVIRFDSKVQGVDWRSCYVWTRPCSYQPQGHSSLKFQYMEVVLVDMSPHHHPQQLLFTKEEYWHKKFVQTCQSSLKHSLDLEARVLNFKGAYLAHLLVFFIPKIPLSSKSYRKITSKVPRSFHVEGTW